MLDVRMHRGDQVQIVQVLPELLVLEIISFNLTNSLSQLHGTRAWWYELCCTGLAKDCLTQARQARQMASAANQSYPRS